MSGRFSWGPLAVGCLVSLACGAGPRPVHAPGPAQTQAAPPPREAVAVLELSEPTPEGLGGQAAIEGLPEEVARALALPPQTRDEALDTWTLVLGSRRVLRSAGETLGLTPDVGDVDVRRAGRQVTLRVRADGWHGALARCTAMVHAAIVEAGQSQAAAIEWLEGQREELDGELDALEDTLYAVPPDADFDQAEALASARAEAERWLAVLPAVALDAPLPPDADATHVPSLLSGLRRQAADLMEQRAQLATRYLDHHPQLVALDARRARLEQRFAAQRERELAYSGALRGALDANPRASAARARLAALLSTLVAPGPTADPGVPSAAAATVRALSHGVFAERQELAVLGERYGERHPERVAQRVRVDGLARGVRDEIGREAAKLREILVAIDRRPGRPPTELLRRQAEVLSDGRARHAAALRAMVRSVERLAREQHERARQQEGRYRVVEPCHAPRETR